MFQAIVTGGLIWLVILSAIIVLILADIRLLLKNLNEYNAEKKRKDLKKEQDLY